MSRKNLYSHYIGNIGPEGLGLSRRSRSYNKAINTRGVVERTINSEIWYIVTAELKSEFHCPTQPNTGLIILHILPVNQMISEMFLVNITQFIMPHYVYRQIIIAI